MFRFQIKEASRARWPIVALIGDVLEGGIRAGDQVSVPLVDGARFVGRVMGIAHAWPDPTPYTEVTAGEKLGQVAIGVRRTDPHSAQDIALGIVTDA